MISVDDCWARSRDASGVIQADPIAFPSGMAALASYAHARGLKFGLYSSNSPKTCAQRPGSFGYEGVDAATYAGWGVDLLKYDNCGSQDVIGPPEYGYAKMRDALNATGRPIFFAACEWAVDFPSTWMAPVANTWRTTYDIQNKWECVTPHVDWQNVFADSFGPGGFGDMDILENGNGVLTLAEGRAHFSLWALMKSPLLVGCDLSTAPCLAELPTLLNKEVLAMSQDPLGAPIRRVAAWGDQGPPYGKSGTCGREELPQNAVIAPCDGGDPLQAWALQPNGTLRLPATGECLQLDSGQGGCCDQRWTVWHNNVAAGLCEDPASCCGSRQQLWAFNGSSVVNNASGQCLTVHAAGLRNVGALPCSNGAGPGAALQAWHWEQATGHLVSSAAPPRARGRYCLARTPDVRGGATEAWGGPLANGDVAVLLWNRNGPAGVNISVDFAALGLAGRSARVRNVWEGVDAGVASGSVAAFVGDLHGVAVLRLTPQ